MLPLPESELNSADVRLAVAELLDPARSDAEKAEFLLALRRRGETSAEIAAFATELLEHGVNPEVRAADLPGPCLDVCGTGGDGLEMFNVSTTVAFVVAAAGGCVAKGGNRAITSRSGGADVLEALGVPVQQTPAAAREQLQRTGFAFFFAPDYYPTFKAVGGARRLVAAQGEKSIFNLLGPLLNPARPAYQLAGIFAREHLRTYAEVLKRLGRTCAWAIHGLTAEGRGMDEVSPFGETHVHCADATGLRELRLSPADFGRSLASDVRELRGGDAVENARLIRALLAGERHGLARDIVLMNAAAALVVIGLATDLPTGMARAAEAIDRGEALARLRSAGG